MSDTTKEDHFTKPAEHRPLSFSTVIADGARTLFGASEARQPSLDALRAASILAVMAQHWPSRFKLDGGADVPAGYRPPFSVGFVGVDMFFVLSGFLIGRQLWKELAAEGSISFRRFFLRRSLRIWPFYYFALLGWTLWHPRENNPVHVSELFFYANYVHDIGIPGSWSLSTEEQFYIVAPILLLIIGRRIPLWGYFIVFGIIQAAVIAARHHEVGLLLAAGREIPYFEESHLHCDGLIFGLALSLVSVLRPDWLKPKGKWYSGWLVFAVGCAVGIGLWMLNRKVYNVFSLAIMFTALTVALLKDTFLQPIWRWRGFQIISMLSFGMYLNHFLFLTEFGRWWGRVTKDSLSPNVAFFLGFALSILVCGAVASITYIFVEHPFLMLRDRLLKHPFFAGKSPPRKAVAAEQASS
jgi:peptidoglycan/LPS O-acetylase OafA/YrhL